MVGSTELRYQKINTASKDVTTYRLPNVHEKSQGLKINSQTHYPQCFNFADSHPRCVYQINKLSNMDRCITISK